jgi:hypothetical protein
MTDLPDQQAIDLPRQTARISMSLAAAAAFDAPITFDRISGIV